MISNSIFNFHFLHFCLPIKFGQLSSFSTNRDDILAQGSVDYQRTFAFKMTDFANTRTTPSDKGRMGPIYIADSSQLDVDLLSKGSGGVGLAKSIFNFTAIIIGGGVLGWPNAFKLCGWFGGLMAAHWNH